LLTPGISDEETHTRAISSIAMQLAPPLRCSWPPRPRPARHTPRAVHRRESPWRERLECLVGKNGSARRRRLRTELNVLVGQLEQVERRIAGSGHVLYRFYFRLNSCPVAGEVEGDVGQHVFLAADQTAPSGFFEERARVDIEAVGDRLGVAKEA